LTSKERSVRGILVTGLTANDMNALDIFEGDVRNLLGYFTFITEFEKSNMSDDKYPYIHWRDFNPSLPTLLDLRVPTNS
jgi:hypothetical protein